MKKGIGYYQVGDKFDSFLLIKQADKAIASNGKAFMTLILGDDTGDIEAKLWDASPADEQRYHADQVIKVQGEVNAFRGRLQLKIQAIRVADPNDGVHAHDFVKRAPLSKEQLLEELTSFIFEMENPNLQRITRYFLSNYQEQLLVYPAAVRNHHEFVSGLAFHVVSMLQIARELKNLYPEINKDLLYAGIILHDIGKVRELSGATSPTYTVEGKLLGHISIMSDEIAQAARELQIEAEEVMILQHMILSHHGKGEWGSPKPPLVREAELLHMIDMIDAKMNTLQRVMDKVAPGDFSERVFSLENRSFYKPTFERE
ncbi:3'-5' exoribonuclease YhaM [Terribacillus saccharophilus]|uniref:3'-5' exoribonuclease YhaM n=1 Tax=Terribacillus saccharophilus TaxID=361277 RepID=UPI000BA79FDE|nr:3'-5' exoribonuclease YhaM [Terribacillus saccharophilus]PAF39193.1 3'-5' exoribonuclease YhaM [Terribacillus saccharophilus]